MSLRDNYEIDKSSWPEGPWMEEPNVLSGIDDETGYETLIVRHVDFGHLSGYVGVYEGHKLFGKHGFDINMDVHGGITWGSKNDPCKSFRKEQPAIFWIGFDCLHMHDSAPNFPLNSLQSGSYKTIEYVKNECASLAKQLKQCEV